MMYSRPSSRSSSRIGSSTTIGYPRSRRDDDSNAPLTAERAMMEQIRSKLEKTQRRLARDQAKISSQSGYSSGRSTSSSHYDSNPNKPPVRSVYLEDLSYTINSGGTSRAPSRQSSTHGSRRPPSESQRKSNHHPQYPNHHHYDQENRHPSSSSTTNLHRSTSSSSTRHPPSQHRPPPLSTRRHSSNQKIPPPPSSSSTTYPKSILSNSKRRNQNSFNEETIAPPPSSRVRFEDSVIASEAFVQEEEEDEEDKAFAKMLNEAVYKDDEEWADTREYSDDEIEETEPDVRNGGRRSSLSSSPIAPSAAHRKCLVIEPPPKSDIKVSAFDRFMRRPLYDKTEETIVVDEDKRKTVVDENKTEMVVAESKTKTVVDPPVIHRKTPFSRATSSPLKPPSSMYVRSNGSTSTRSASTRPHPMSLRKALPPSIGALSGLASGPITFALNREAFYEIVWETGEFGFSFQRVYLEEETSSRHMYLRMLLNTERATCASFQQVHVGDVLIQVGDQLVSEMTLDGIGLTKWFTALTHQTPLRLVFQRMDPMEWEGGVEL